MALFENFPYTNLQQLNLDWLIDQLNKISESSVLSVNGQTGVVTLYENAQMVLPNVPEDNWTIIRMCDGTYRGILFGNDDKAYIVHDNLMAQIYSQNNQPPYPVTRVNGQYGDVVLYPEQALLEIYMYYEWKNLPVAYSIYSLLLLKTELCNLFL